MSDLLVTSPLIKQTGNLIDAQGTYSNEGLITANPVPSVCESAYVFSMLITECGLYVRTHILFWHFFQSVCLWAHPSNNSSLPLLLGCTAGSAPQHLASLTQNASSSSRRVSPLCSTELIAALSRNQVEALWVNETVQRRPRVKSLVPLLEERRNSPVSLIEYLSIYCNCLTVCLPCCRSIFLTTVQLTVLVLTYQAEVKILSECVFLRVLIVQHQKNKHYLGHSITQSSNAGASQPFIRVLPVSYIFLH